MKRRVFTALAGTTLLAGCIGGDDTLFEGDVEPGETYEAFEASEGDELAVTIEAGADGANVGISATELDGIEEGENWWGWELEPDEGLEDTITIVESGEYTVWINEGEATVTVEAN